MSEYIVELDGPYAAGYHVGEEIVRCRDCKHRYEGFCMLTDGVGDFKRWLVDEMDYCSDGEVNADE